MSSIGPNEMKIKKSHHSSICSCLEFGIVLVAEYSVITLVTWGMK